MKSKLLIPGILILVIVGIISISGCIEQEEQPTTEPEQIEGAGEKDIEQLPESVLQGLCEKESWPPDCSFIPDPKGRELCEKCRELRTYSIGFERNYPEKIKSAFVLPLIRIPAPPGDERKKVSLEESLLMKDRLKANTYSTQIHYHYRDGKFDLGVTGPKGTPSIPESFTWQDIETQIKAAKEKGLAVNLMITWGYQGTVVLKDRDDLSNFLKTFQDALVEVAEVAEKYKVEYLSLYEPDHVIRIQQFSTPEDEMVKIIDEYKEETLPKLRKVYNGRLYYQVGDAWAWDFTKLNVSGLDFFGVLIGGEQDFSSFKNKVDTTFERAESLSKKSGVPWVISELWIGKKYDNSEINRAPYYDYVFEKAKKSENLIGIVVDTWNVDESGFETSVKNTTSEQTIKEFFENWN